MDNADTLGILRQLERGEINAEQADERLQTAPPVERDYQPGFEAEGAPHWVRRLWGYPLLVGLGIVGLGTWVISATARANILWFICGLPILLLGSLVVAIAASAESGHWLYVEIKGTGTRRRNFQFALPFPIGLLRVALWIARLFGKDLNTKFLSRGKNLDARLKWTDAEELLTALERELREGRPFTVDVDDKNGRVQVYIV